MQVGCLDAMSKVYKRWSKHPFDAVTLSSLVRALARGRAGAVQPPVRDALLRFLEAAMCNSSNTRQLVLASDCISTLVVLLTRCLALRVPPSSGTALHPPLARAPATAAAATAAGGRAAGGAGGEEEVGDGLEAEAGDVVRVAVRAAKLLRMVAERPAAAAACVDRQKRERGRGSGDEGLAEVLAAEIGPVYALWWWRVERLCGEFRDEIGLVYAVYWWRGKRLTDVVRELRGLREES